MTTGILVSPNWGSIACGGLLAAALLLQAPASAQQNSPSALGAAQPAAPVSPPAETPAPARREGFVDAFGRWLDQGAADFKANLEKMKEFNEKALQNARELNEKAQQSAKEAAAATAAATKDATEALIKLPNTRVVEGKEKCEAAPNGSPDCNAAAEKICKSKGFGVGKSAEIQQVRKCPARAWLGGGEGACTNESIVVRATCQ
ncbi:MAG: hypothetical protein AB7F51_12155 [Pseudorhodoplanes sp.]